MRELSVYWWKGSERVLIGRLGEVASSPIVFEWDKAFLRNSVELSPLTFKKVENLIECRREPFNGLPGLFADCVPDGWGKILLRIGLSEKEIHGEEISPLDALAYIGDSGLGALSFEPSLKSKSSWGDGKISLSQLERGVGPILEGTPSAVIGAFLENGASPNGMRPKILLKEKEGKFYSSASNIEGSEWLIKFRSPSDPPSMGKLEYIYSLMAKEAGLTMPETKLFISEKKEFFGVRRFDRTKAGRVHIHTLSGMLNVGPGNFSVGYEHLAKVAQAVTGDFREVVKVIRLATFNVLASNQDDHSKNVAFMMDKGGDWALAPAYDLTFHRTSHSQHKMLVNDTGAPTEKDILALGKSFGLSKSLSDEIIDQVKSALSRFRALAKEHELSDRATKDIADVISPHRTRSKQLGRER